MQIACMGRLLRRNEFLGSKVAGIYRKRDLSGQHGELLLLLGFVLDSEWSRRVVLDQLLLLFDLSSF